MAERYRQNWLEIDASAIAHNARRLAALVAPSPLCAVVKADAYGHGALVAARAALDGGAAWLAVALVEEGLALRRAGIGARILLLSEPTADGLEAAVRGRLTPTLYTAGGVESTARAARALAGGPVPADLPVPVHVPGHLAVPVHLPVAAQLPVRVHLKVDTGMHRVGADPREVGSLGRAVAAETTLRLEGLWSHLAVADLADSAAEQVTALQLERLHDARRELARSGVVPELVHLANSAGAIAHPGTRLDLVRCGIALYGYPPVPAPAIGLRPGLTWKARVHLVRRLEAGEAVSYGLEQPLERASLVAVVPAGYHDGIDRRFFEGGGEVLIRGRRCRVAGRVTMDQLIVDCGPGADVACGDEVVLIGRQGDDAVTAEEWANRLGTISYEVLCGIGPRVPRVVVGNAPACDAAPPRPPEGAEVGSPTGER